MKKWIAIFLLSAMLLSLAACKGGEQETQATQEVLTEEQVSEETTKATEETTKATEETTEATEETAEATEETTEATEETAEATEETVETTTEATTEATEETAQATEDPTQTEPVTETEPVQGDAFWAEEGLTYPMAFYFSSGAGAWGTELNLNEDGSFTGSFRDTNMGENGENYPYGTTYICNFTGKFGPAERLDMYTYGMKLEELILDRPEGEEWIEEGMRYISWTPYGLEGGEDFVIYLPNMPVEMLSEEAWFWWPGRYQESYTTINGYGLYNLADDSGFYCMTDNG